MEHGEQGSLRDSNVCRSAGFGGSCRKSPGQVGGWGSQGAREADVTNFSSAPGWPEAARDFPVWKDRLGNQATRGPLPHPSWVLSAG